MKGCVINWTRRLHSARRVRARVSTPQPKPNKPHPHPHAALQHCSNPSHCRRCPINTAILGTVNMKIVL